MAVSLVDLLDPGRYYPVYQLLLSMLDSLSIVRLSKTCRGLATLYRGAIRQEWSVDRLLGRFVSQPLALRSVMRDHGAVISGSFALQFFARQCWKESSLDLVVEKSIHALALGSYLVAREGYKVVPKEEEPSPRYLEGTVSDPPGSKRDHCGNTRFGTMFGTNELCRLCIAVRGWTDRFSRY
jgi:hypothetical protein